MPGRAQGFPAVVAVVGVPVEFLKDWEHPGAIVEEDFPLHDEHVAEAGFVALEEGLRILLVIGVHAAQDLIATLQIIIVKQGSSLPQCTRSPMLVNDFLKIAEGCGDNIVLLDHFGDVGIVETIFSCGFRIDIVIHDFAIRILLMRGFGEIEVPAVMAETVVIGVDVLPCPVLRSEFAIAWIAFGNVFSVIIMERPRETVAALAQAYLYRLHDDAIEGVDVLMRGDEETNALLVVLLERFRIAGLFSELRHMMGGDLFHFMESDRIFGYLIGGNGDGIGHCEPVR